MFSYCLLYHTFDFKLYYLLYPYQRLRAENEYIKAENEVIKKEIALRENNYAAQLKAKKQQSSKNSKKKDTN